MTYAEKMKWDDKFREFLLTQDARNKKGYMKEDDIKDCIKAYYKNMSDNYDTWRITDLYKTDFISSLEMKEIQKESNKKIVLYAIGIAVIVGAILIF